jgi:hypothetical protein
MLKDQRVSFTAVLGSCNLDTLGDEEHKIYPRILDGRAGSVKARTDRDQDGWKDGRMDGIDLQHFRQVE